MIMRRVMVLVLVGIVGVSCYGGTTYVSGTVSGVWDTSGSPYIITDTVWIARGDSLRIGPGVDVLFDGPYMIIVDSALFKAVGNETDSIVFTALDTMVGFKGIDFDYYHTIGKCTLAYCQISYMDASDYHTIAPIQGGNVAVLHCFFTRNTVDSVMGGPSCLACCDNVRHCVFRDNNTFYWGDIHRCNVDSSIFIENENGTVASGCNISNSQFYGCGVSAGLGWVTISNCYVDMDSGGPCITGTNGLLVKNCVLKGGTCVECYSGTPPVFINCDFIANSSYFTGFWDNNPIVINSIFYSSNDSVFGGYFRDSTVFSHSLIDSSVMPLFKR